MADLIGTRALARELGVSSSAVTKAVKEKRLTPAGFSGKSKRPMFNLESVRKQWRPLNPAAPGRGGDSSTGGEDNARYQKARADKEESLAAQELLNLAAMEKTLLPREELVFGFTQFLRVASQALSGIPAKTLSRFPGLTSEGRDFLTQELRTILDDLGEWEPDK